MSYILDALRRADAERERGSVPGLHSANLAGPVSAARTATASAPPAGGLLPAWLLAVAVAMALLGALAWWAFGRGTAPAATPPAEAGAPVALAAPAAPPPPATIVVVPMAAPQPSAAPAPTTAQPPLPSQAQTARAGTAEAVADTTAPPAAGAARAVPARADTRAPDAAAADPPVLPLAQLSAEQRQQWPALAIGGSIWSDNPAQRFVIANGQVVREGETAAPGVVVDRIEARRVLLRWQGLRVEVPL